MVMVGGRPFSYREVSQRPELVEQMSAQEKEAYIEMGQNLFQDIQSYPAGVDEHSGDVPQQTKTEQERNRSMDLVPLFCPHCHAVWLLLLNAKILRSLRVNTPHISFLRSLSGEANWQEINGCR
ncbi:hypothetical protein L3Q82_004425 [Scortum barcoo]|uniref:Uncharacterized protein n=1 Tax=Scortum barcoo TaxID=214431 RepID=A0ACB8VKS7_9TELE|nr:hypothetical protein L3Q82_004425 [Scortum barcoo]